MEIADIFSRVTGFGANKLTPIFLPAIEEIFNILKDYVTSVYELDRKAVDSISFDYINALGLFCRTIRKDGLISIVFGANSDILLDWSNCLFSNVDKGLANGHIPAVRHHTELILA